MYGLFHDKLSELVGLYQKSSPVFPLHYINVTYTQGCHGIKESNNKQLNPLKGKEEHTVSKLKDPLTNKGKMTNSKQASMKNTKKREVKLP